jgi:chromosomal replication initiation ATPase DnaA
MIQVVIKGSLIKGETLANVTRVDVMGLKNVIIVSKIDTSANARNIAKQVVRKKNNLIKWCYDIVKFCTPWTKEYVESSWRKQELVAIRICIANKLLQSGLFSLREVGEVLGNRDHATIIHYQKKFDQKGNIHLDRYKPIFKLT